MLKTLTMTAVFPALGHDVRTDVESNEWTCWLKNVVSSLQQHLPRSSYSINRRASTNGCRTGHRRTHAHCLAGGYDNAGTARLVPRIAVRWCVSAHHPRSRARDAQEGAEFRSA